MRWENQLRAASHGCGRRLPQASSKTVGFPNPEPLQGQILPGGAIAEVQSPKNLHMLSCKVHSGVVQVALDVRLQTQHRQQKHRVAVKGGQGLEHKCD